MGMYDRIVVPTDGSTAVRKAVHHAIDLADAVDAAILPIYVIDMRMSYHGIFSSQDLEKFEDVGEEAVSWVEEAAEERGVETAAPEVRRGVPFEAINTYADEANADLVVMGTHGRTGIDRFLLGSTAENMVRSSDVPVMTVRMKEHEEPEYED